MTIDEVTLNRPKIGTGFSVFCWFCRLRLLQSTLNFSTEIFPSLLVVPALEWVLGIRSLFLTILLFHLRMRKRILLLLTNQHFLCFENRTTTCHPVLTVAILLTYLHLLVGRLFQRYHLSRIDEVLKCGDSMSKPHMLSQIPSSCPKRQLPVLATVPRILPNFFQSHVQILFYTDNIEIH